MEKAKSIIQIGENVDIKTETRGSIVNFDCTFKQYLKENKTYG